MIRLPLAALLALTGSVLLHGAGMLVLPGTGQHLAAGGVGAAPPLLGDSFADLSEGMAQAVPASDAAPAVGADAAIPAMAAPTPDGVLPRAPDAAAPAVSDASRWVA